MLDKRIVEEIVQTKSECSLTTNKAVCSPAPIVKKMAEFLKTDESDHKKIVGEMKELLNCNSESCVIKHPDFVEFANITNEKEFLDKFFNPQGPAHHFGLLSNFNIDEVLDRLEDTFEGFFHIPFQMRDFEKVGTELATIDLAKRFAYQVDNINGIDGIDDLHWYSTKNKNGPIKNFGVVLNTDWSSGGGIHWYCIFGERLGDKIILEYFNSSGRPPLTETQIWLHKTKAHIEANLPEVTVSIIYSTGIRFQSDEHSCGVYCLMYIWLRLKGVSRDWFTHSKEFTDHLMHSSRKVLFRHEN